MKSLEGRKDLRKRSEDLWGIGQSRVTTKSAKGLVGWTSVRPIRRPGRFRSPEGAIFRATTLVVRETRVEWREEGEPTPKREGDERQSLATAPR